MLLDPLIAGKRPVSRSFAPTIFLGAAALCVGLLGNPSRVPVAHAALGACAGDPVVVLSNGVVVDLNTAIGDDESDVQQIIYTLHAPVGAHVVAMIHTSGLLGPKEVLQFAADDRPNTYDTMTRVTTSTPGVAVTASTSAVPLTGTPAIGSASGYAPQSLQVSVTVWTLAN